LEGDGASFGLMTDLRGDVVGLVDASGFLVESYDYDPYGARELRNGNGVLVCSSSAAQACGSSYGNTQGYAGRFLSAFSGLYDMRARSYSPYLRQFVSPDPLGYGGGGFDLWSYANGDPVNLWDTWGLAAGPTDFSERPHWIPSGSSSGSAWRADSSGASKARSPGSWGGRSWITNVPEGVRDADLVNNLKTIYQKLAQGRHSDKRPEILRVLDAAESESEKIDYQEVQQTIAYGECLVGGASQKACLEAGEAIASAATQPALPSVEFWDLDEAVVYAVGQDAAVISIGEDIGPVKNSGMRRKIAEAGYDPDDFRAVQYEAQTESEVVIVTVFENGQVFFFPHVSSATW
jgi:RHS repeat-associated protein